MRNGRVFLVVLVVTIVMMAAIVWFPSLRKDQSRRRRLTAGYNFALNDPRTIESKMSSMQYHTTTKLRIPPPPTTAMKESQQEDMVFLPRTIEKRYVLSLGGSTTWGSKLKNRRDAYPYVLETLLNDNNNNDDGGGVVYKVIHLALRATDASYASKCMESMMRNANDVISWNDEVDMVLLEYSINGVDGMDLLLRRLKRRYPKAMFVYVHLYSLRMNVDHAVTGAKPRSVLNEGKKFVDADAVISQMLRDDDQWIWSSAMMGDAETVRIDAMDTIRNICGQGYLYQLPIPTDPKDAMPWFGPDYHHLNPQGHHMVAQGILKLYLDKKNTHNNNDDHVYDGSWGKGDQCYCWYETGYTSNLQENPNESSLLWSIMGGTMKMFVKPDKWALHVGLRFGQPATIRFANRRSDPQPVELMHMSWGPGVYPKTQIQLRNDEQTTSMVLDPLPPNPNQHVFHVTRTTHVGTATPGVNEITLDPMEERERPLRVVGIVMCNACIEMDPNNKLAIP